jgi:hypothetical protein
MRKAFGPTISDWIAAGDRHDGNGVRGFSRGHKSRRTVRKNDVHLQVHQLGSLRGQPIGHAIRVASLDDNVPPFDVPELAQTLPDSRVRVWIGACWRGTKRKNADLGSVGTSLSPSIRRNSYGAAE